jgi:Putative adhesin
MNRRRASVILGTVMGGIAALLLLAGMVHARSSDEREEFHQSYSLSASGRVEVANVNGDVTISAGDGNEVKVDAVKRGSDARELSDCKIVVDSHPDWIRIETKYPEHSHNNASVDYTIRIPRSARLGKANLVNGNLTIEGITGGIDGSAVNGNVRAREVSAPVELSSVNSNVEVEANSTDHGIHLHSVNGRVQLTLPSDSQAEITASTVSGSIRNDFGLAVDKGQYVGSKMKGRLGAGMERVELNTVNGAIELRHANDGRPLSKPTSESASDGEPI